jgi:hypothetical protein
VNAAVEAFQNADRAAWKRLLGQKAEFYDDGSPSDFKRFTQRFLGQVRFICIDRMANNGLYIEGDCHSDEQGSFRMYFNFELNGAGRIVRLDIGRVEDAA